MNRNSSKRRPVQNYYLYPPKSKMTSPSQKWASRTKNCLFSASFAKLIISAPGPHTYDSWANGRIGRDMVRARSQRGSCGFSGSTRSTGTRQPSSRRLFISRRTIQMITGTICGRSCMLSIGRGSSGRLGLMSRSWRRRWVGKGKGQER